jgi:hypothetical protein
MTGWAAVRFLVGTQLHGICWEWMSVLNCACICAGNWDSRNLQQFKHRVGPLLSVAEIWLALPRLVLERHYLWVSLVFLYVCQTFTEEDCIRLACNLLCSVFHILTAINHLLAQPSPFVSMEQKLSNIDVLLLVGLPDQICHKFFFFFLWARRHSLRMHRSLRLIVLKCQKLAAKLYSVQPSHSNNKQWFERLFHLGKYKLHTCIESDVYKLCVKVLKIQFFLSIMEL